MQYCRMVTENWAILGTAMVGPRAKFKRVKSTCLIHALRYTHPDRRTAVDALRIYFVLNRGTTVKLGILMETRQQLLTAMSLSLKLIRILAFVLYTRQRDGFDATCKHGPLQAKQHFCQNWYRHWRNTCQQMPSQYELNWINWTT